LTDDYHRSCTKECEEVDDWLDADSIAERAHEAFDAGRFDEAETALREAIALDPHRPEWHFNLGLTLEAAGEFVQAAEAFADCHELSPRDVQPMLGAGLNLLRAEDFRGSIRWFERVQELDPDRAASFVHRIEAYARLGDHDRAEEMFYRSQQIDAEHADAYANIAVSLLSRGQAQRAAWCLTQAAQLDPTMPRVHARLAEATATLGKLDKARQLYLRELRNAPGDIDTLLDLGCLLVDMNRPGEASEKFRRVLEQEPENAHATFYLAELAEHESRLDDAIRGYVEVLSLDTEYAAARRRLASCLLRVSHPLSGARTELREGAASRAAALIDLELTRFNAGTDAQAELELEELGQLLLDADKPEDAARVLESLATRRRTDAQAWHMLSLAYFTMGDRVGGTRAARRALRIDRELIPAIHNLAVAAAADRRWTRAAAFIRGGLRLDPSDAGLRRLRVLVRFKRVWFFGRSISR
jgi:tetratricopeptide (TPR) repeat protein